MTRNTSETARERPAPNNLFLESCQFEGKKGIDVGPLWCSGVLRQGGSGLIRCTFRPVSQQAKHERGVRSIQILSTEGRLAHCTNDPFCVCPTSYVNFCRLVARPSSEGCVAKKMRLQSPVLLALLALLAILPFTLAGNSTSSGDSSALPECAVWTSPRSPVSSLD
jgi:hypothetical protein